MSSGDSSAHFAPHAQVVCGECSSTGWTRLAVEAEDGNFEEAYYLCPLGCTPMRCSARLSSGKPCVGHGTNRVRTGHAYCDVHARLDWLDGQYDECALAKNLLEVWAEVAERYENDVLALALEVVSDYVECMTADTVGEIGDLVREVEDRADGRADKSADEGEGGERR